MFKFLNVYTNVRKYLQWGSFLVVGVVIGNNHELAGTLHLVQARGSPCNLIQIYV